jgi:hypothetical protein
MANPSRPYHSTNPTDPDVYHVFSDCPNGQQIPPENHAWGTNDWGLCGSCRNMGGKPV